MNEQTQGTDRPDPKTDEPVPARRRFATLKRLWRIARQPSTTWSLGGLVLVGGFLGIIFWGGFNWSMELTNTETFCISCHEMERNVFLEYRETIHYSNRTGVRATCPDCHVPKDWFHKVVRKIRATNELYHHFMGTINTRAKFEAKRTQLAVNVWRAMKTTDSRECRNCHSLTYMDYARQEPRAARRHEDAAKEGRTCIDCHKGIAHTLPPEAFQAAEALDRELAEEAAR